MKNNSARPPIIIIGMHRSGTGMLTLLLEELCLFIGKEKEENNEALFFFRINEWLLHQCGAAWDHPQPLYRLLSNFELRTYGTNTASAELLKISISHGDGKTHAIRILSLYGLTFSPTLR